MTASSFLSMLKRPGRALAFAAFFLRELVIANIYVAAEVVTPRHRMRPAIVRVSIESRRPIELMLLGNLISLTPGTLTLEIADNREALYVHAIDAPDPERVINKVRLLEHRLLRVLR